MNTQTEYDRLIEQATGERDFRKRETLFLEAERLRKQLTLESNNNENTLHRNRQ